MSAPSLRVAIDTGGTFTDVVAVEHPAASDGARVWTAKVRSTPHDPAQAVAEGLKRVSAASGLPVGRLIHGTTVATNALLEGRPRNTWLVVDAGFEDLLQIGRQHRPQLYALQPRNRPLLVPHARTVGVVGRLAPDGTVWESLDLASLEAALHDDPGPRSWAVCLLHSYANPAHERAVRDRILALRPQDRVSLSSEVLPVMREVERASTTVANAYVLPLMAEYLHRLAALAPEVSIMGSSGGLLPIPVAAALPVHTAVSGPAGGVVGAARSAEVAGVGPVVAFDMGGTSTDVTVCAGPTPLRYEGQVGEFPIAIPMLDIHTIGAGGGSLVRVDAGGALGVGPLSAGADPGPACYGKGTEPTVTDAHVVLGHLPADLRLGGETPIEPARAWQAFAPLAESMGTDVPTVAAGALRIATERMAQAIRAMTVARGLDPRGMTLAAFGGAGGLHVCDLADTLGMRRAWLPARAGLLSAAGMLMAPDISERSQTVLGQTVEAQQALVQTMLAEVHQAVPAAVLTVVSAELRYKGQSFELRVPWQDDRAAMIAAFCDAHGARFGYTLDAPVEAVTLRVRAEGPAPAALPPAPALLSGPVAGPCAIVDAACTLWLAAGWTARPDGQGGAHLERMEDAHG